MTKPNCPYTCIDTVGCNELCTRYRKMNHFLKNSNVDNYMDYIQCQIDLDRVGSKQYELLSCFKDNIKKFVTSGDNLFIFSRTSQTGKTLWSVKIMFKYFDEVWGLSDYITRGYLIPVNETLTKLKDYKFRGTEEYEYLDKTIKETDLIIWDGITDWELSTDEQKLLSNYIKHRFSSKKSNIFNGILNYKEDGCTVEHKLNQKVGIMISNYIQTCEYVEL